MPSGAFSIVIPVSPTEAMPDASISSIVARHGDARVARQRCSCPGRSPARSVKRQCSSDFVGSGIAW